MIETIDKSGVLVTLGPPRLGGGQSWAQLQQDRFGLHEIVDAVRYLVRTDQSGTLELQESEDSTAWVTIRTVAVQGGVTADTGWTELAKRYWRIRYVNGSQQQGEFLLFQSIRSGAVMTDRIGASALKGAVQDVATAGTRVQLPDYPCRKVILTAKKSNTGSIFVGGSDVSSAVYGVELQAGESITLEVQNTNRIYLDASTSGEGVSYIGI